MFGPSPKRHHVLGRRFNFGQSPIVQKHVDHPCRISVTKRKHLPQEKLLICAFIIKNHNLINLRRGIGLGKISRVKKFIFIVLWGLKNSHLMWSRCNSKVYYFWNGVIRVFAEKTKHYERARITCLLHKCRWSKSGRSSHLHIEKDPSVLHFKIWEEVRGHQNL